MVRPPLPQARLRSQSHARRFESAGSQTFLPAPELRVRAPGMMFFERRQRRVEEREMFRPSIMNDVCWQMMDLLNAKRRGTANPSARKLWQLLEQWERMLKEEE